MYAAAEAVAIRGMPPPPCGGEQGLCRGRCLRRWDNRRCPTREEGAESRDGRGGGYGVGIVACLSHPDANLHPRPEPREDRDVDLRSRLLRRQQHAGAS